MRLSSITFIAFLLLVGCEQAPRIPGVSTDDYPSLIKDSPDSRSRAERQWRRMLDAYGVQQTPPDLYPITNTPRSLLGVSGGITIVPGPGGPYDQITLREAVKLFVERWSDLIGVEPAGISLVAAGDVGGATRLTYRQATYSFPIADPWGEMTVVISDEGRLIQLDDRFIPTVTLPQAPSIRKEDVAPRIIGRVLTYSDFAGKEREVRIGPSEVKVKELVVLPVEMGDGIAVHLAWQAEAGSSLVWTIYIDAMDGKELRTVQNFNT